MIHVITYTSHKRKHVFYQDAAWEVCDDFERECEEHIRSYVRAVEMKCFEMRQKVGEAEKAGVDWTNSRLGQMQHQVSELRRREDKLNLLRPIEDPVQFVQVTTIFRRVQHLVIFVFLIVNKMGALSALCRVSRPWVTSPRSQTHVNDSTH